MDKAAANPARKYWPLIGDARPLRRYQLGDYRALLLDNIQAAGRVQYLYILEIYHPTRHRCLAVAAEVNSFTDPSAPPAYFLGVFHGDRRENLGVSAEWGDLEKFTARALEIARQELGEENVVPL